MQERILNPGDVVQISPEMEDHLFGGCFMVITETKSWGAQGFIAIPQNKGRLPAEAYYRVKWEDMEYVGGATWIPKPYDDDKGVA